MKHLHLHPTPTWEKIIFSLKPNHETTCRAHFLLHCQKGFSLVELLIILLTIGIISSIAIPQLRNARFKAQESVGVANLRAISSVQVSYRNKYERYGLFAELNAHQGGTATSGPLGDVVGSRLQKGLATFQLVPATPTEDELRNGFTVLANLPQPDGSVSLYITDQKGQISLVSP
ncbi:MAG: prepilin-type N-terminal cleavage/methylation domain-containing protein [Blastocatellia bacterium]